MSGTDILQMTSPEVARDLTEDMFHVWFFETPNGPLMVEKTANGTQEVLKDICIGPLKKALNLRASVISARFPTMYVNFETRCHPDYLRGSVMTTTSKSQIAYISLMSLAASATTDCFALLSPANGALFRDIDFDDAALWDICRSGHKLVQNNRAGQSRSFLD